MVLLLASSDSEQVNVQNKENRMITYYHLTVCTLAGQQTKVVADMLKGIATNVTSDHVTACP